MTSQDILNYRLINQQIASSKFKKPADLVSWMGAVQAQDYLGGLWAIGLRTGATLADIEKTIAEKKIIRTWPMRGTLHFLAGSDTRWILELLTQRANASAGWATRRKFLGLTEADIVKSKKLVTNALRGGKIIARKQLYEVLASGGVSPVKQRGLHILSKLAHELVICFGPHQGKQATFVLLEEWLPKQGLLTRDKALAKVAEKYFTSHGPATIYDFCWWSNLKVSDAKLGIEMAGVKLKKIEANGKVYWIGSKTPLLNSLPLTAYLLPPFDEYLVSYKDRSDAVADPHIPKIFGAGNGIFSPVIIINGKVAGTWGRVTKKDRVIVKVQLFSRLTKSESLALESAVERYGKFMNLPAVLSE